MFLTYSFFAEIPEKLHLFYEYSYHSLLRNHDLLKEGFYKREFISSLNSYEYLPILKSYAAQVYYKEKIDEISRTSAEEYLGKAISKNESTASSKDVLDDLKKSLCILLEDGPFISFTHRSFQEYFTALYLVDEVTDNALLNTIKMIENRSTADIVLQLSLGCNRSKIEKHYIIPRINEIITTIESYTKKNQGYALMRCLFDSFEIVVTQHYHNEVECSQSNTSNFIAFLFQYYPESFSGKFITLQNSIVDECAMSIEFHEGHIGDNYKLVQLRSKIVASDILQRVLIEAIGNLKTLLDNLEQKHETRLNTIDALLI